MSKYEWRENEGEWYSGVPTTELREMLDRYPGYEYVRLQTETHFTDWRIVPTVTVELTKDEVKTLLTRLYFDQQSLRDKLKGAL